jgi:hypothetical protein
MSTSSAGSSLTEAEQKSRRELLLKVYGAAIDEYRFNVQLGWDHTKFFLLLSSGLIAAGVGLLKVAEGSLLPSIFLVSFFLLSLFISAFGLQTTKLAKGYYREAVFTKTLVERELGLLEPIPGLQDPRANLSIAVTRGQRDTEAILSEQSRADDFSDTPISSGTVAFNAQMVFWVMIAIEALAAIATVINASVGSGG